MAHPVTDEGEDRTAGEDDSDECSDHAWVIPRTARFNPASCRDHTPELLIRGRSHTGDRQPSTGPGWSDLSGLEGYPLPATRTHVVEGPRLPEQTGASLASASGHTARASRQRSGPRPGGAGTRRGQRRHGGIGATPLRILAQKLRSATGARRTFCRASRGDAVSRAGPRSSLPRGCGRSLRTLSLDPRRLGTRAATRTPYDARARSCRGRRCRRRCLRTPERQHSCQPAPGELTASTALPRQSVQRGSRAPAGATTRDRSKWSPGARRGTSGEPWPDQDPVGNMA